MSPVLKDRLSLEACEAREVPANLVWTNTADNGLFGVAANWRDLDTNVTATAAPVQGDTLIFDGELLDAPNCNTDLKDLHGFDLTETTADFAAISLVNGYSGKVTLVADATPGLSVGAFTLTSGAIAQPNGITTVTTVTETGEGGTVTTTTVTTITPPPDLSVLDTFTWTGGILNSSDNPANLFVRGVGVIAPAEAGTVTTNDTLQFIGAPNAPASTTMFPGTLAFGAVGGGLIIGGFATLTAKTFTTGDVLGINKNLAGAQKIEILANGTLNCIGPGKIDYDLRIVNRGSFNLTGSVRVNLTGKTMEPAGVIPTNYGQGDTGGLGLENGSVLTASDGLNITGGVVYLTMNPNLPASQQTATINGKVFLQGGTILFAPPIGIGSVPFVYGTFTVNGDVNWTGGTYKPSVDYTTAGMANKWIVNGKMTSAAACVIEPNPQRGATPPASSNWDILQAETTAGNLPSVVAGSTLTLGQFDAGGKKVWKLASPAAPPN